jgi:hypothetical protein
VLLFLLLLEMDKLAEGLVERQLDLGFPDVPLRFLVAPGQAQKEIAGGSDAPRHGQVGPGAEGVAEPAVGQLGPKAQRRKRAVLCLVEAVKHH